MAEEAKQVGEVAVDKFKSGERAGTSLVPTMFRSRPDVAELAERLKMMVVGGEVRYNAVQALTLAQAALAHGLSPFNGEIYLMIDKKTGQSLGLVIGVKGLRKHARRQARRMNTMYDIKFEVIVDPDDLATQAPTAYYSEDSVVVKATLTIASHIDKWLEQLAKIHQMTGMTARDAIELIGPKPEIVAYGVYDAREENHQYKGKTKMSPITYAKKRGEAAVLKEGFDLPFGLEYDPAADDVFGANVHDFGEDEFEEGVMTMEMDEVQEEYAVTKTATLAKEEEAGQRPASREESVGQLGFAEDRFKPDTSRKKITK